MSTIDTNSGVFATQSTVSEATAVMRLDHLVSEQQDISRKAFESAEIRGFRSDDAMAGGMVGIILSFAFLVLLGLVTAVNVWMARFAN